MDKRKLGWLEGMIDGEECLSIYKNKTKFCRRGFTYRPRLSFSQTDSESIPEIIKIISEITGLDNIGSKHRYLFPSKPQHKPQTGIWFESKVLRKLLPQLKLIIKEKHRLLMIKALNLLESNRGRRYERTKANDDQLDEIYKELKSLIGRKVMGE